MVVSRKQKVLRGRLMLSATKSAAQDYDGTAVQNKDSSSAYSEKKVRYSYSGVVTTTTDPLYHDTK